MNEIVLESENGSVLESLKKHVNAFPKKPGVYLMKDEHAKVIYVGKAKELRARVRSYFLGGDGRAQITFLLRRIRTIDTIVTESEHQAFVLERDLIAKYKPRYNIKLKDDKAYLSIRVDENERWPRLELVRKLEDDGAKYFGPYSFSYELRSLLEIIKRVIPLRTCSNTVFHNRARPCLEFQIKRCAGPCCLPVEEGQYRKWVKQAISILEGKTDQLVRDFTAQMDKASEEMRFEDAALYRDRIDLLKNFSHGQRLSSPDFESRDCFALYREERLATLAVLKTRAGRIIDSETYSLSDVEISDEEVVESAISQFYEDGHEIPSEVVLPVELQNASLLEDELTHKAGTKVSVIVPQRGARFRLLNLALMNAREHFLSTFDSEARYMNVARAIAKRFNLRQIPRRIECIDISNLQGSDIVGALVSFFDGNPDKSRYRKYKISQQEKPDDFASICEVVTRRLTRGKNEGTLPDLLMIDGGPGQLSMALKARDEVGVDLEIISIAKARTEGEVRRTRRRSEKLPERVYLEGGSEPISLPEDDEISLFLSRVRDEVHRFVITFHRARRAKRVFRSKLDDILGLGPERRGRLLRGFGSVENIKQQAAEDIARVGRMPLPLAEKVLRFLHEGAPTEPKDATD